MRDQTHARRTKNYSEDVQIFRLQTHASLSFRSAWQSLKARQAQHRGRGRVGILGRRMAKPERMYDSQLHKAYDSATETGERSGHMARP